MPKRTVSKPGEHTFMIGQTVRVDMGRKPRKHGDIWGLRGQRLKITDTAVVPLREQVQTKHHQRVKVCTEGEALVTDWLSGASFELVK